MLTDISQSVLQTRKELKQLKQTLAEEKEERSRLKQEDVLWKKSQEERKESDETRWNELTNLRAKEREEDVQERKKSEEYEEVRIKKMEKRMEKQIETQFSIVSTSFKQQMNEHFEKERKENQQRMETMEHTLTNQVIKTEVPL